MASLPSDSSDKGIFANRFQSNNHPSKDIKGTYGSELIRKKIVICITASVACFKSIDLIRLFIRHGAEVFVVISKAVEKFIGKEYFVWASGNPVTTHLSGELEHVRLANYNNSDLVIVYPCTANTIGKFANGIDDTSVTSVLSIALGSKIPIIISPAMHEAMYYNPIIKSNINKLEQMGVIFTAPVIKEDKAKVSSVEEVFRHSMEKVFHIRQPQNRDTDKVFNLNKSNQFFCKQSLDSITEINEIELRSFFKGKKILISLGSTIEYIDPIRLISNTSSGKMGFSLIKAATRFGLDVTILKGITQIDQSIYKHLRKFSQRMIEVKTTDQMADAMSQELYKSKYDVVILSAAVSDFKPQIVSDTKISTENENLILKLIPTIKIVDKVKQIQDKVFLVAFKAEYSLSLRQLITISYSKLLKCQADFIVANDVGPKHNVIGSENNKVIIIDKDRNFYDFPTQKKEQVAEDILKMVYLNLNNIND
jgi:phosphopantothenoylcysteine decarboxylase/phosphopantothenate--cysteine ligase